MSKEREAFEAFIENKCLGYENSLEVWEGCEAHYQPLLAAKDAEIADLRKKRGPVVHLENALGHLENASAAQEVIERILRAENTTLKALLEQAREGLRNALGCICHFRFNDNPNVDEITAEIVRVKELLAAINAATGEK